MDSHSHHNLCFIHQILKVHFSKLPSGKNPHLHYNEKYKLCWWESILVMFLLHNFCFTIILTEWLLKVFVTNIFCSWTKHKQDIQRKKKTSLQGSNNNFEFLRAWRPVRNGTCGHYMQCNCCDIVGHQGQVKGHRGNGLHGLSVIQTLVLKFSPTDMSKNDTILFSMLPWLPHSTNCTIFQLIFEKDASSSTAFIIMVINSTRKYWQLSQICCKLIQICRQYRQMKKAV